MTRIRTQTDKEISALAKLKDSDIDTSDIAPVPDWSQAVAGRFHDSGRRIIHTWEMRPQNRTVNANTQPINYSEITHTELKEECSRGTAEAWQEFAHRYNRLIASVLIKVARQWGTAVSPDINDLVQEVYLKLARDNYRLLKAFSPRDEHSIFGFLKVVAANIASDYFRIHYAAKRGGADLDKVPLHSAQVTPFSTREREMLVKEIDQVLKRVASPQESEIFRLYYYQGLTAREIASIPSMRLTIKGVESLLRRLRDHVRNEMQSGARSSKFPK